MKQTKVYYTLVPDSMSFSKLRFNTLEEAKAKQLEWSQSRKKEYSDKLNPYYVGYGSRLFIETVTTEEIEGTHVEGENKNNCPVS